MKDYSGVNIRNIFLNFSLQKGIIYTLIFLPVIYSVFFVKKFVYNMLFMDQYYVEILKFIQIRENVFSVNDLFALHNDFRPVIPAIIQISTSFLTDSIYIYESYFSLFMLILSFLLILYLFIRQFNTNIFSLLCFIPVSWYIFNGNILMQILWGLSLYYTLCLFFVILTVIFINKSKKMDIYFFSSICTAFLASYSFTSGMFVWFTVLLYLILCLKKSNNFNKIVIWIASALCFFYVNYIFLGFTNSGIHGYSGYSVYLANFIHYPLHKSACILGSIGSTVVTDPNSTPFFGGLLIAIILLLLWIFDYQSKIRENGVWICFFIYSIISAIVIALTRSGDGTIFGPIDQIFFAAGTRHLLSIFLLVISIYCITLSYLNQSIVDTAENNVQKDKNIQLQRTVCIAIIFGIIFSCLFTGAATGFYNGIKNSQDWRNLLEDNEIIVLTYKEQTDEKLLSLFPYLETIKYILPKMEQYHIAPFK